MTTGVTLEDISARLLGLQQRVEDLFVNIQVGAVQVRVVQGLSDIDESLGTVMAGEFRAGNHEQPGDGFSGVRMAYPGMLYNADYWNIAGVEADVLMFGVRASDGRLLAGAGAVILDQLGITATAGLIGGWALGTDYIRDAANTTGMASTVTGGDDVRFWAGAAFASRATAPFRVTEAGALVASSATITGSITATSGTIGGWTIGATKLSSTGIDLNSGASAGLAFGATPPASATSGTGVWLDRTGFYGLVSNARQVFISATTGTILVTPGTSTTFAEQKPLSWMAAGDTWPTANVFAVRDAGTPANDSLYAGRMLHTDGTSAVYTQWGNLSILSMIGTSASFEVSNSLLEYKELSFGTSLFKVTSSGIATISGGLNVGNASGASAGQIRIGATSNPRLYFTDGTTLQAGIFYITATDVLQIFTGSGGGTTWYFDLVSPFGIMPASDNTRDIGSGALRVRRGYFAHLNVGTPTSTGTGDVDISGVYNQGGTKVVGGRDTGYSAMTGTANKGTVYDTATVTLAQLAGRMMSIQASLTTHGLIGA